VDKISAIYCRVSSRDQSHASQLPDLERWAEAHGWPVATFKDTFTGKSMNRPGMDRLIEELRAGRLDIVVWRLDRLGRTTKGLCQLFDELTERKIDLVSLKDGFSLASPAGRLHARILASVAEYETEVRAERVAAGQAVARRKGKKWGGSKKGWRVKRLAQRLRLRFGDSLAIDGTPPAGHPQSCRAGRRNSMSVVHSSHRATTASRQGPAGRQPQK
jgi:DNA invertase Pin-like site-specific DNA recombinase